MDVLEMYFMRFHMSQRRGSVELRRVKKKLIRYSIWNV